jgi:hypothetical protein
MVSGRARVRFPYVTPVRSWHTYFVALDHQEHQNRRKPPLHTSRR